MYIVGMVRNTKVRRSETVLEHTWSDQASMATSFVSSTLLKCVLPTVFLSGGGVARARTYLRMRRSSSILSTILVSIAVLLFSEVLGASAASFAARSRLQAGFVSQHGARCVCVP